MVKELENDLFDAVKSGNIELVRTALKNGVNVNAKDEYKEAPIIYASQGNSLQIVKELLENGAKIDFRGEKGWTPLRYAVDKGKNQIAVYLIESGADISSKDKNGETPLYGAVLKRNQELIKLMIKKGADVNAITKGNSSCLKIAVSYPDNLSVVKQLVEADVDLTFQTSDVLGTAIFTSATYGGTEVVEYLLESGVKFIQAFEDGTQVIEFLEKYFQNKKGTKKIIKFLKARKSEN